MKTKAIYAGSFDPLTNGHSWIIDQSIKLFDELVIAVAINPSKKYEFTLQERVYHIKKEYPTIEVVTIKGEYLADYAKDNRVSHLVRGIRSSEDFAYEKNMFNINKGILQPTIETVFFIPPKEVEGISSSFVKGMLGQRGWNHIVNKFVSTTVFEAIQFKYLYNHLREYNLERTIDMTINSLTEQTWRKYHNLSHLIDMFGELNRLDIDFDNNLYEAILIHDLGDERKNSLEGVTNSSTCFQQ